MTILQTIFEWTIEASLRAALLVPVVLGFQWLLRRRLPASWRYALWLPVLVALLVPSLPILPHSVIPAMSSPETPVAGRPAPVPAMGGALAPLAANEATSLEEVEAGMPASIPERGKVVAGEAAGAVTTVEAPASARTDWRAVALWTWLVSAVAGGVFVLGSLMMTVRRVKRAALPVDPALRDRVTRLARAAGLRRGPRVWRSSAVTSPAVCGVWRPVLLLNAGFEEHLSEEEVDLVLRHELAHIRRGDLIVNAVQCGLLALHWFNPLVWLAFFRARADREAACDEAVLRGEPAARRAAYGHALLKMETAFPPSGLCLGFVGILQGRGTLRTRIQSIIARRKLNVLTATVVAVGIAVFALAGITGVGAEPEADRLPADPESGDARVDPLGAYDLVENKDHPGYIARVYKWTKDISRFDAGLRNLAEKADLPDKEDLKKRLESRTGEVEVITDGRGGAVDFNAAEGTFQYEANKKFAGRSVDWEFELASDTTISYDGSTSLLPEMARVAIDGEGENEAFRFFIRIAKTDDGPFKAGDRVRLRASIDDFSRFRKGFTRATGLVAIYYLEDSPNPVYCLRFDEADVTLIQRADQDAGTSAPAEPEGEPEGDAPAKAVEGAAASGGEIIRWPSGRAFTVPANRSLEIFRNEYKASATKGMINSPNLALFDHEDAYFGCGIDYKVKMFYKGTKAGKDYYLLKITYPENDRTRTVSRQLVYEGKAVEVFRDDSRRIVVRPQTVNFADDLPKDGAENSTIGRPTARHARLPELAKAFPGEKLVSQTKLEGSESYGYATDLPFEALKKKLTAFLGEGWKETEVDPSVARDVTRQYPNLLGSASFTSPAFPKVHIFFTQIKQELEGRKSVASIMIGGIEKDDER